MTFFKKHVVIGLIILGLCLSIGHTHHNTPLKNHTDCTICLHLGSATTAYHPISLGLAPLETTVQTHFDLKHVQFDCATHQLSRAPPTISFI